MSEVQDDSLTLQVCSLCGITQTPVWRRLNKALVCNACGLKKRRSASSGRPGAVKKEESSVPEIMSVPVSSTVEILPAPKEEQPQHLQESAGLEVS